MVLDVFVGEFFDLSDVDLPSFDFVFAADRGNDLLFGCSFVFGCDLNTEGLLTCSDICKGTCYAETFHFNYLPRENYIYAINLLVLLSLMLTEIRTITACYVGSEFPSVSVTGSHCDQMCEHCKAVYLRKMVPVESDKDLIDLAHSLSENNGNGMLISGGCDRNGTVPVLDHVDAIKEVSDKGLLINIHTGFIGYTEARKLADAGVSCFSVDIHQDPGVIKMALHLEDREPDDYSELLDALLRTGVKVVPHVTVGFGYYDLVRSGQLILSKGLRDVVLLALIPTKGTAIEDFRLTEDAVIDAVSVLSSMGLRVTLGCMRDRTMRNLEVRCIESGVKRLVNPTFETLKWAANKGYVVKTERQCCALTL